MNRILSVAFILAMSGGTAAAAGNHPFGLGVQLGAPTGLSGKLYLDAPFALQMGVGFIDDFDNEDGFHLHVDFLWHPAVLTRQPAFTLPFYFGVGARLLDHDYGYRVDRTWYVDEDTHIGVRVPFGLLMDFNRVSLDIFLEFAIVIDLVFIEDYYGPFHHHHDRVDVNGSVGIRYYF